MNFKLKILTPVKELFNNQVESLIIPSESGSLGIFANHSPIICILKKGKIKIKIKSKEDKKEFLVENTGIFKFNKNEAIILADTVKDLK